MGGGINNAATITVGGTGGATLWVNGGSVNSSFNNVWGVDIGHTANQPGTVNISSGTLTLSGANGGIVMGNAAPATWNQTGRYGKHGRQRPER